jgi:hypothetical protein
MLVSTPILLAILPTLGIFNQSEIKVVHEDMLKAERQSIASKLTPAATQNAPRANTPAER